MMFSARMRSCTNSKETIEFLYDIEMENKKVLAQMTC